MHCALDRIDVHYEAFGEGLPLVVLPGWPDTWKVPASYLEPLFRDRAGWRRVYLDLPGRGKTKGEPWIASNDDILTIVLEVIDRLAPEGPIVLAGHSAGAYLARGVLHELFGRVDGLLQVVPVIRIEEKSLPAQQTVVANPGLVARVHRELGRDLAETFASRIVTQTPAVYRAFRDLLPAMKDHDTAFLARIAANESLSFGVDDLAAPFEKPALFVLGRQDAVVGFESALALTGMYPRATMTVVDGAGHALPWEQPRVFGALVRAWLHRVEQDASRDVRER